MLFTQTAEYAVRAVLCLGLSPGRPLSTHQIARQARVPAGYLAKVLQTLRRARLVRSTRGTRGGFVLAHQIESLTLYDIIQVIDPIHQLDSYPLCDSPGECALRRMHQSMNRLTAMVRQQLQTTRLCDLLQEQPPAQIGSSGAA